MDSQPTGAARPPDDFREKVLALTLPAVRWRARRRRAKAIGALLGAYAIGAFSAWSVFAPEGVSKPLPPVPPAQLPAKTVAVPDDGLDPAEREALAMARLTPEERREVLRADGNRWLNDHGDIARATRCYRRYLDAAPAAELKRFDPQDTWLLRTLRCARLQENAHDDANT